MWYHIDADLSRYHPRIKGGGRGFFIKFGRKNVKVFEWAGRHMYTVKRYVFDKTKMDEYIMKQVLSDKSRKSLLNIMTNKSSKNEKSALFGMPYHHNDLVSYEKEIIKQLKGVK